MPRQMPQLVGSFRLRVQQALELANKIELARSRLTGRKDRSLLHPERMELVYEMAFFRYYLAWEEFLEETFVRYLAGYASSNYAPVLLPAVSPISSLASARTAMLGGAPYKLWHDPAKVSIRSAGFLVNAPHQLVINSALTDLERFSRIRHRIAHAQDNAKTNFDAACIAMVGHTLRASRPGKLLRMTYVDPLGTGTAPAHSWLQEIANVYVGLAQQIG
jgi:hypothetical protein